MSEGDTLRWAGDRDLLAGLAYLRGRPDIDPDRIGGFGFSIGGEMLLEAPAQADGFKAIASEGAGGRSSRTSDALGQSERAADQHPQAQNELPDSVPPWGSHHPSTMPLSRWGGCVETVSA